MVGFTGIGKVNLFVKFYSYLNFKSIAFGVLVILCCLRLIIQSTMILTRTVKWVNRKSLIKRDLSRCNSLQVFNF